MPTLTKLTLPVKENGVITNKTYDLPTGAASIIVEVSASSVLAGRVCYCYDMNDALIAKRTLNSSGNARFELTNSGTYKFSVISEVYETITVESNNVYQLHMNIFYYVNVTIISAINDVVYFTDAEGLKTVVTDSTGKVNADIALSIGTASETIEFHSTVAKMPDDQTEYFHINRRVTNANDQEIYVAPAEGDKLLFWYGYKGAKLQTASTGWTLSSGFSWRSGTTFYDTRLIFPTNAGDSTMREAIVSNSEPINHLKCHVLGYNVHLRSSKGGHLRMQLQKSLNGGNPIGTSVSLTGAVGIANVYHYVHEGDNNFNDAYSCVYVVHASDNTYERAALYGFWLV